MFVVVILVGKAKVWIRDLGFRFQIGDLVDLKLEGYQFLIKGSSTTTHQKLTLS